MTAAELYEIVKDDPEVWASEIHYGPFDLVWVDDLANRVHEDIAELALEALYARATGCGVVENGVGTFDAFDQFVGEEAVVWTGPTRLAALVAAYRAGKEAKR